MLQHKMEYLVIFEKQFKSIFLNAFNFKIHFQG